MLASRVGGLSTECAGPAHSITVPSCCVLPCWPMPRYCRRPDKGATFSTESADFCLSRGAENGQKRTIKNEILMAYPVIGTIVLHWPRERR
ncbi:hypothetical protein D3C81_625420 [compost metagenome]